MSSIYEVIFYSLIGGLFSLVGGLLLLSSKKRAEKLTMYATPFAAGALLSAAFVDLLPEALHDGDRALTFALVGILGFFVLERFLRWFHHHHEHEDEPKANHARDPNASLIIIGDILHNFIDGIAIAAGFLVDPSTGVVVTLAVAAHEIPQEIGDFALLLHKGLTRKQVLVVNVVSALFTTLAAVIFFQLGQNLVLPLDIILGVVAGFFVYIAVSDIIPSIHANESKGIAGPQTLLLILGALIVGLVTSILHDYIDQSDHSHNSAQSSQEEHHYDDDHE